MKTRLGGGHLTGIVTGLTPAVGDRVSQLHHEKKLKQTRGTHLLTPEHERVHHLVKQLDLQPRQLVGVRLHQEAHLPGDTPRPNRGNAHGGGKRRRAPTKKQ